MYFAKMISSTFQLVDRGQDPRHGIWNDPVWVCLPCQHIISEFTERWKTTKPKTKRASTLKYECEKMAIARLDFNFISLSTQFRGRWELGLPTSSSVVHLRKMMLRTMFRSMQTFCERQISYTFTLCVCSRIGLLFIIFICSFYSPWATIGLLHHFGIVCALI